MMIAAQMDYEDGLVIGYCPGGNPQQEIGIIAEGKHGVFDLVQKLTGKPVARGAEQGLFVEHTDNMKDPSCQGAVTDLPLI
jgi:hypothetical protein